MEVLNRQKKKVTSFKARLINFYNRHHSNSPILTLKKQTALGNKGNLDNVKKNTLVQDFEKKDFDKELENQTENFQCLQKVQSFDIEKWLQDISNREKNLELREADIRRRENELEQRENLIFNKKQELDDVLDKFNFKEKELKREEEAFNCKRINFTHDVTKEINEKVKELELQKLGLDTLLKNVMAQIVELDKRKEEMALFQQYRKSLDGLDRIDEESEEGSLDLSDNISLDSYQQKNFILTSCQELSKENEDISSKIDEIMASLSYSSSLF